MGQLCDNCINKTKCAECDKKWKDKFIPSDAVRKYFKYVYVGSTHGFNGRMYSFDNANKELVPTHRISIRHMPYCPYCGNKMWVIQDDACRCIGHTCICEGARNEIEYEEKLKKLEEKYKADISELKREYADKLVFCTDKLLQIKHEEEKYRHSFDTFKYTHMGTLNGEPYTDIDQIVR